MSQVVGSELHFETVGGLALGQSHDPGVVAEAVQLVVPGREL